MLFSRALMLGTAVAAAASCRASLHTLPDRMPFMSGHLTEQAFATDSAGPGHLYRFGVRRSSADASESLAPEGYFRVDSTTRWVVSRHGELEWDVAGVPNLRRAYVRVWLRGAPTSVTPREVWGRAALVVVDSLGT